MGSVSHGPFFFVEVWLGPDRLFEEVATSRNRVVAQAAFDAVCKEYSMRVTLRDRMSVLAVREDVVTGKVATAPPADRAD